MVMKRRADERIDLLQGTLDMMVLRALTWGPQHGHGIGVWIRTMSEELLQVEHGSLYPALHRLQRRKLVAAEWRVTENKQRAKYYRLTPAGKKQLTAAQSNWDELVAVVARVMRPAQS